MDFFLYSDENKKKTLIALLVQLNQSDHRNHTNEIKFIEAVGSKMGLSSDEIYDIRLGNHDFEINMPKQEDERMLFFMHLIHLIKIDNEIAPQEEFLIKDIGLKLGINTMLISELVDAYKKEIDSGQKLSADRMKETIRKYLN